MGLFNLFKKEKRIQQIREPPLSINQNEAQKRIFQGSPVLDVRTKEEFEHKRIPNSTLIPLQELQSRYQELSKDPVYIIVCEVGERSALATTFLRKQGYKAYNLQGGLSSYTGELEYSNEIFIPENKIKFK